MRVLQLIDSLEAGGAERLAVNIANALSLNKNIKTYLCATRKEGLLKNSLNDNVGYLLLKRKTTFDISAIKKLNQFVKCNHINIIHAHSTSFFLAVIIKALNSKIHIVWHDHYGNSEFLEKRKSRILRICSKYFSQIICVNYSLKAWSEKYLNALNISYLPNFAVRDSFKPSTLLKGVKDKRILHLANLRPQKDHMTLLHAFKEVIKDFPEHTLHCVGKIFDDEYSKQIMKFVYDLDLSDCVFFYGSKNDVSNILNQSDICVLSSNSEGLPIALLEYGLAEKPTVVTNVGNCNQVIENGVNGIIVDKEAPKLLAEGLLYLVKNKKNASMYGNLLKNKIEQVFSKDSYVKDLITIYNSVLSE